MSKNAKANLKACKHKNKTLTLTMADPEQGVVDVYSCQSCAKKEYEALGSDPSMKWHYLENK